MSEEIPKAPCLYGWTCLVGRLALLFALCPMHDQIPIVMTQMVRQPRIRKAYGRTWYGVILRCGWTQPVHIEGVTGTVWITEEQWLFLQEAKARGKLIETILAVGPEWPGTEKAMEILDKVARGEVYIDVRLLEATKRHAKVHVRVEDTETGRVITEYDAELELPEWWR